MRGFNNFLMRGDVIVVLLRFLAPAGSDWGLLDAAHVLEFHQSSVLVVVFPCVTYLCACREPDAVLIAHVIDQPFKGPDVMRLSDDLRMHG